MLVVKSLLSGSLTVSPLPSSKQQRRSVSTSEHTLAVSQDDDEVTTTLEHDRDDPTTTNHSSCFSTGSTCDGDSFVLAIDWERTSFLNDSLSDPYLESKHRIAQRLHNNEENLPPPPILKQQQQQQPSPPSPSINFDVSPAVKSLGSFTRMPATVRGQSLGTLEHACVPTNNDQIITSGPILSFPKRLTFATPNQSAFSDDDDDDDDNTPTQQQESFAIPETPTLTKVTPSRKRRHRARICVRQLREELHASTTPLSPLATAKRHLTLAKAELQAGYFLCAVNNSFQAAALFRQCQKRVAVATSLDLAAVSYGHAHGCGMAQRIHQQHKVAVFFQSLQEAIAIRKRELGPCHVDTVNSLQHLAQLCYYTGHPSRAADHYMEVVHFRQAIHGPHHPSTAVTCHCLGNALLQCHDSSAAQVWYDHAMDIYNTMDLPDHHSSVQKLVRDRAALARVELWRNQDPKDDEALLFEL